MDLKSFLVGLVVANAIILAVCVTNAHSQTELPENVVWGYITMENSGYPVEKVQLKVERFVCGQTAEMFSEYTGSRGDYMFGHLVPAFYIVTPDSEKYIFTPKNIMIQIKPLTAKGD